jgi:LuxR family maltose regulon positive regulatory protein
MGRGNSPRGLEDLTTPLTGGELRVLQRLPTMMTISEIAAAMFISFNTVEVRLKHLYEKLEVKNRRQAVHRARHWGLLADSGEEQDA